MVVTPESTLLIASSLRVRSLPFCLRVRLISWAAIPRRIMSWTSSSLTTISKIPVRPRYPVPMQAGQPRPLWKLAPSTCRPQAAITFSLGR